MAELHPITGATSRLYAIGERLWLSGRPVSLDEVEAHRINTVISVGGPQRWMSRWMLNADEELVTDTGSPHLKVAMHAPLIDSPGTLDPVAADAVIDAVCRLHTDPVRRILIHCDAGVYRSVHVAACVLSRIEGIGGGEAMARIDGVRSTRGRKRTSLGFAGWDEHLAAFTGRVSED